MNPTQPYIISNERNITELLAHFDSNYIFDMLQDKLENIDYSVSLPEANIIQSFEEYFKIMNDQFPGDSQNIRIIRQQVYTQIIDILCKRFNLRFNTQDDTIDIYTAAYHLYDFLISRRNEIMVNFFVSFIVNNKGHLFQAVCAGDNRRSKDSSSAYNKNMYTDVEYIVISANMEKVINYISTFDIRLVDIFRSIYPNQQVIMFLDNAFADNGNFFNQFYCSIINKPEILPIVITNIRLSLQRLVGCNTGMTYFNNNTEEENSGSSTEAD